MDVLTVVVEFHRICVGDQCVVVTTADTYVRAETGWGGGAWGVKFPCIGIVYYCCDYHPV